MIKPKLNRALQVWILVLAASLIAATGFAETGSWPGIQKALRGWSGSHELLLRTSLKDPLGSPAVQNLLEELLAEGFRPTLATTGTTVQEGLVLDLRDSSDGLVAILSDAGDGRILALERQAKGPSAELRTKEAVPEPRTSESTAVPPTPAVPPPAVKTGEPSPKPSTTVSKEFFIDLPWRVKRLALAGSSPEKDPVLVLLSNDILQLVRLEDGNPKVLDSWNPGLTVGQALYVGTGDIDGDGKLEIAAVWADEIRGIYQGTNSLLHAWVFAQSEGRLKALSQDLKVYLRFVGDHLLQQQRGAYVPYLGPVLPVEWTNGQFRTGTESPWPEGLNLYAVTPLPQKDRILVWGDGSRLRLRSSGGELKKGDKELVADLGTVSQPAVAIPLPEPENRSGLEKEDRIYEHYYPLTRRTAVAADGRVFTFIRGRSQGIPLMGTPSGQDQVARIEIAPEGLTLERPFAGVESYILDFSLLPRPGRTDVLVLLNDKEDGAGTSRLLIQSPR